MVQTRSYTKRMKMQRQIEIPLDVVSDILLGFSVKTLSRFKCVCKSWRNLLEDPIFQNRHFKYSEKHKKTFFKACFSKLQSFSAEFYSIDKDGVAESFCREPFFDRGFLNMASCDGLICSIDVFDNIQICNPATEETITLPYPTLSKTNEYNLSILIGFGFDSILEKYKVICWDVNNKSKVRVFTIGTKSWRDVDCPCPCKVSYHSIRDFGFPVYLNGMSHWYYENKLLSFNFSEEIFRFISLPIDNQVKMAKEIFEVRGCLCVVGQVYIIGSGDIVKIWSLVNYENQKWVCKQVILPWLGREFSASVVLVRDGEILMQTRSLSPMKLHLFAYNEEGYITSSFKIVSEGYGMFQSYTESLASLRRAEMMSHEFT